MHLALVSGPAAAVLDVVEVRCRLALDDSVQDLAIDAWVRSETARLDGADGILGRALVTQTWDVTLDGFPGPYARRGGARWGLAYAYGSGPAWRYQDDEIALPLPPLQAVVSITYLDSSGTSLTVDPARYRVLRGEPAYLVPMPSQTWPSDTLGDGSVTIRIRVGYGDAGTAVPEPIRSAIVLGATLTNSLTQGNLFVTSETVEGVGSTGYSAGVSGAANLTEQVKRLIAPYRVGGGIS